MRRLIWLVLASAIVLAACGGGGDGGGGGEDASCSPNGTKLSVSAQDLAFSTDCLAAPANQAFTIAFDNKDKGTPHNVSIHEGGNELFAGKVITGPAKTTYSVPALEAGTYEFMCDVHPQMHGTFVVE